MTILGYIFGGKNLGGLDFFSFFLNVWAPGASIRGNTICVCSFIQPGLFLKKCTSNAGSCYFQYYLCKYTSTKCLWLTMRKIDNVIYFERMRKNDNVIYFERIYFGIRYALYHLDVYLHLKHSESKRKTFILRHLILNLFLPSSVNERMKSNVLSQF